MKESQSKKTKQVVSQGLNLRDIIAAQLIASGYFISSGAFSDKSGSWLEVYKEDINTKKQGTIYSHTIAFDFLGNVITGIRTFSEELKPIIHKSEAKLIF